MAYSVSDDLEAYRPNIHGLGVPDWTALISEGDTIINRTIELEWYRPQCRDYNLDYRSTIFDSDLLLSANTQLKRLSCFKALELAYLYLMKDAPEPDAFERQVGIFQKKYKEELKEVLASGLDYDWDDSGDLAYTEKLAPKIRRLQKC